ncbi:hypothetical protein SteCoe_7767 [Stentor coeruleus]|uniref:DNA/RNA-binding protein Alba-like domain-containing protein n=1 Tax=Stentor coeruleus TaxID=5963 RepID=A0A1R2CLT2_9CILI|nr:hypothetical protein SteCoe_7767 [Stentor coeruleus]
MSGLEVAVSRTQTLAFKVVKAAELLETHQEVYITAINSAISSAIYLVELLKHRVKGLHQDNKFERVENTNKTRIVIKLSLKELSSSSNGYQKPIPESDVQEKSLTELKKLPWEGAEKREDGGAETRGRGRGRYRGRGRGRGGRRPGRGGAPRTEEPKDETSKVEVETKVEDKKPEDSGNREFRGRGERRFTRRGRRGRQDRGGYVSMPTPGDDRENDSGQRRFRGPRRGFRRPRGGERRPPRTAPIS